MDAICAYVSAPAAVSGIDPGQRPETSSHFLIGKARGRHEIETAGATRPECLRSAALLSYPHGDHFEGKSQVDWELSRQMQRRHSTALLYAARGLTSASGEIINIF
jgi:hypothetical protein